MSNNNEFYMSEAIREAYDGVNQNHGGPFGAVIVKDGTIIGRGHNRVLKDNDPTCHGEIAAIRDACKNINSYDLSGCDLYTTGECCTMCLCASLWANINHIYYGATLKDNELIGFRDDKFDKLLGGREKLYQTNYCTELNRDKALELFKYYSSLNAIIY